MRRKIIAAAALGTTLAAMACQPSRPFTDADREAILQVIEANGAAGMAADWDAFLSAFAEDAVVLWPDQPPVSGIDALRELTWYRAVEWEQSPPEVVGSGDLAYVYGAYSLLLDREGATREDGKHLSILRRQPDGSWRFALWMNNAYPASTAVPVRAVSREDHEAARSLLAALPRECVYDYADEDGPPQTGRILYEGYGDGRFVKFDEQFGTEGDDPVGITGIIGYDDIGGFFTWYRAVDNGAYDRARGTLVDGGITFDILEARWEPWEGVQQRGPGVRLRTRWTGISPAGLTFLWEQSVNGGPWEHLSTGSCTGTR